MRQFRRLQRIKLKTRAQRSIPPAFAARMIAAHRQHPSTGSSDPSIIHEAWCPIQHGGGCTCTPEIFIAMPDGSVAEVDVDGCVRKETRQ